MAAVNARLQPLPLPHTSCGHHRPYSASSPSNPHLPHHCSGRLPCAAASLSPLLPSTATPRLAALPRLQREALRSRVRAAWTHSGTSVCSGVGSISSTRAVAKRAQSCTVRASAAAGPSAGNSSSMSSVSMVQPDDWHLHLRDGADMESVVGFSAAVFKRAIIMPNLRPPITTTAAAVAYRERILHALAKHPPAGGSTSSSSTDGGGSGGGSAFEPLMTLYLTDATSPDEIERAKASGVVHALKLYPAGATTNSEAGVTDLLGRCIPTLETMAQLGLPLLVHGEVVDPNVDFFDREKVFIHRVLSPLLERVPDLRVVMEHITTADAADFVLNFPQDDRLAATVTPQHLLWNRNALFVGGLRPHHFCLPVLKRETHRAAVVQAATSGSNRFFLGTDSAPHERRTKESPCGCAGIFSAHAALALYATAFEQAGALDKLEAFASFNGPDFYRLPRNMSRVTITRQPWVVPDAYPYGGVGVHADGGAPTAVVPMMAGEEVQWTVLMCSD